MDKYESYAVGHHLTCWPEHCSFTDLMQWLRLDNEDSDQEIWVCQAYEDFDLPSVALMIEQMVTSLRETFK